MFTLRTICRGLLIQIIKNSEGNLWKLFNYERKFQFAVYLSRKYTAKRFKFLTLWLIAKWEELCKKLV